MPSIAAFTLSPAKIPVHIKSMGIMVGARVKAPIGGIPTALDSPRVGSGFF